MATKKITAKKISQPNAYKGSLSDNTSRIPLSKIKQCKYAGQSMNKHYRQWTDIKQIIQGKQAQCGSTEGPKQGGEVQHIGGPSGTYPQPALLHIYNFDTSAFDKYDKIENIEVSIDYRVVNVTPSGHIWTENLATYNRAALQGVDAWFSSDNPSHELSKVIHKNNPLQYEYKDKNGKYIWKTLTFKFTDITIAELMNSEFAFNIQFGYNCSSAQTTCFLYVKNFKTIVTYKNSQKYIEGSGDKYLYTSSKDNCCSTISHTIEAGYKHNKTKISPSSAPEKLGGKIKVLKHPANVTITKNTSNDLHTVFNIIDKSGKAGQKSITYCLTNDEKTKITKKYTAKLRQKPNISLIEEYKFHEDYNQNKSYITYKGGCANQIKIYTDYLNSTPITFNLNNNINNPSNTVIEEQDETNLITNEQNEIFHTHITSLPCGYHNIYIQIGNETITDENKFTIQVSPMRYKFNIYSEDNPSLVYTKANSEENNIATLKIKRVDNEPITTIPILNIIDETNKNNIIKSLTNVKKGDTFDYQIDLSQSGHFFIKLIDPDTVCPATIINQGRNGTKITIKETHKQNYDYLFTRGEDGTAFDIDYLVAWEGDIVKTPINVSDITLKHSIENDIRICSDSIETGISKIGLIQLNISNLTQTDTFENVQIELNTLVQTDEETFDVTTNEWTSPNGIFNNFYNLFYDYNQDFINDVKIQNLTPDNDLVDEENVYLLINKIDPKDTITLYLPYYANMEKTIYLQYLLFEQALPIYTLDNCNNHNATTSDMIQIKVIDNMQTQLEITGNLDLLKLDNTFSCPTECYTTTQKSTGDQEEGITYKITNIDTNDFNGAIVSTEIINSNEMEPYGYYLNDEYYDISITNNKVLYKKDIEIVNINLSQQLIYCYIQFPNLEKETIMGITNNNGKAVFNIPIPITSNKSYTTYDLLNEVLYFKFYGHDNYTAATLFENDNPFVEYESSQNKTNTIIDYNKNYRKYKPGEVANISVFLSANIEVPKNRIIFNASLQDYGSSDEVTILYKICNLENNQGVFSTTFKTNDKILMANKISKDIYCGYDTNLIIDSKLEKTVVEKENLNILYINVKNTDKPNKNVKLDIDLGQHLEQSPGDYSLIDINIDSGDYGFSEYNNSLIPNADFSKNLEHWLCNDINNVFIVSRYYKKYLHIQSDDAQNRITIQQNIDFSEINNIEFDVHSTINTSRFIIQIGTTTYNIKASRDIQHYNLDTSNITANNDLKIIIEPSMGTIDISPLLVKKNLILSWLIGDMDVNQVNKGIIKIKAQNIGLSNIYINASDYLTNSDIQIKESKCIPCQNKKFKLKNSAWEEIEDDDGKKIWVKKND